jgi:hypothetical protein
MFGGGRSNENTFEDSSDEGFCGEENNLSFCQYLDQNISHSFCG